MLLPTRIGPLVTPLLTHTGQPDRSSRRPHTHTRLLFLKPCAMLTIMGPPWTLHPRTSTVLAHDPMLGPRFRISIRAAPQRRTPPRHHSAPRQLSAPLCAAAPLYTSLHRAPLWPLDAPLRITSLHLSLCALQLPVLGLEPTVLDRRTHRKLQAPSLSACLSDPFSVRLRRQGAAAAQQGGGRACQLERT